VGSGGVPADSGAGKRKRAAPAAMSEAHAFSSASEGSTKKQRLFLGFD